MITLGKRGDLHARRRALRVIRRREVAAKVFDDLAERYRDRAGGYTRIVKADIRPGDAAAMSIVELVEGGTPESWKLKAKNATAKKKTTKKKTAKKTAKKAADEADEPADDAKPAKKKASAKKAVAADSKAAPKKKKAAPKKKAAKKKDD
jgi:large subunit ribosomal protein L17